jgi:hypothetical protein
MWQTLLDHYRTGAVRRNLDISQLRKQLARSERTLERQRETHAALRATWSFRAGHAITAIPRAIRKLLSTSR